MMEELTGNEAESLLSRSETNTIADINSIESYIDTPEFSEGINKSIDNVSSHLSEITTSNPNKSLCIVYGGKSRLLTGMLLDEVGRRSGDETVKQLVRSKVRLDDQENEISYDKYAGNPRHTPTIIDRVRGLFLTRKIDSIADVLIFVDDHVGGGRKAQDLLNTFKESHFVAFVGPDPKDSQVVYSGIESRIFVGNSLNVVKDTIKFLSSQLSSYVNIRLNKNIKSSGQYVKANIDTLDPEYASYLRKTNSFMGKLKEIITEPNPS